MHGPLNVRKNTYTSRIENCLGPRDVSDIGERKIPCCCQDTKPYLPTCSAVAIPPTPYTGEFGIIDCWSKYGWWAENVSQKIQSMALLYLEILIN
jgi:hypothetical protein